jgi:hypothetical protein
MTEEIKKETPQKDPMDDFILKFEFSVSAVNAILQVLGSAPFVAAAPLINMIQVQGEPQFKAALEAESNKAPE